MAQQIQATIYNINGFPQPEPFILSFSTNDIVLKQASLSTQPEINTAIQYYFNIDSPGQYKTFYVSESIASINGNANIGITTQILCTVILIDDNSLQQGGIIYSFPANNSSIWPITNIVDVNSFIEYKGSRYYCAETESVLFAAANARGSGSTATWGTITGILSAQTDLQTALNSKVDGNTSILGGTKTKITYDSKGLITSGTDATTADINDSSNRRYVTDTNLVVINNTSGTNTGDQTITLTGDVTGSGTGSFAATIGNDKVTTAKVLDSNITYSKIQNISANRLLGNPTGVTSSPSEIPLSTGLAFIGGALTNTSPSSGGTVTNVSVATTNGFAGSVATSTSTPAITLSTTITGVLKGNGTSISAATVGTDYSLGTSGLATGIIKSTTGTGNLTIAVAGDFPILNQNTTGNAATATKLQTARNINGVPFDGSVDIVIPVGTGTVTTLSVVTANGFAGNVSNPSTTPSITLSTTITGLLKGNGTSISAAASGTDYSLGTSSLATGILKSTTTTGALSIAVAADFPILNQNTTGNAATVTTNANLTGPITSVGNATSISNNVALPGSPTTTTQTANDNSTKIATTSYVDSSANLKIAVKYASTVAYSATYSNGTLGVGATLTGLIVGAISIDGITPIVGDRLLINNQVSTFQNGIYVVTTVGTAGTNFVLTRSTDFDQLNDINQGAQVFVFAGTANSNTIWTVSSSSLPTMGTSAISFTITSLGTAYSVINGTTANTQGNQIFVNHNISSPTKILSMCTFVDLGGGTNIYITSGYRYSTGYEFSQRVDNTQIVVSNVTGNSGNILNLAFRTYLEYKL